MAVIATGSVAFDYILTFRGRFAEHVLPDQAHILNLSFLVDRLEKRRGGVAPNYAHNLALLGVPAAILATAGTDAGDYRDWLAGKGIECSGLKLLEGEMTACGFITTDLDDNQITGYYGGAMLRAGEIGLDDTAATPKAVIVGPNAPEAMARLVGECRERGIPWVFDPSHQLPQMTAEDVIEGSRGAWILIGNDYELELVRRLTGCREEELAELAQIVVTTRGRHGSQIVTAEGGVEVPPAPPRREADPTGAGDAYRAGLVSGLLQGLALEEAGRMASLAATYAIEQVGTIEHSYTLDEFAGRYQSAFGHSVRLPSMLW